GGRSKLTRRTAGRPQKDFCKLRRLRMLIAVRGWCDEMEHALAANSACSLPPCGGGLGRGVATERGPCGYPPPCPSPTRGEGTQERSPPRLGPAPSRRTPQPHTTTRLPRPPGHAR